MKELSLHLLDVAKNSVAAGATWVDVSLDEDKDGRLTIVISDNGRGMSPEFLAQVTDPFTTTRTTRKVGLGLPLYRMAAEQTGGSLDIQSTLGKGTTVTAVFHRRHLDCPPLGDLAGTVALLIQGSPELDLHYRHTTPRGTARACHRRPCGAFWGRMSPGRAGAVRLDARISISEQEAQMTTELEERFMKSLEELKAIREKMKQQMELRDS